MTGSLSTFDPWPAGAPADDAGETAIRQLIRRHARDKDDEELLLDVLGVGLERRPKKGSQRDVHGTHGGYVRHMHSKTKPCRPCMDAKAAYTRKYRNRNGS